MPSIQQLQLNAGNYSQSQRCRTRIGDLRLRKEMFRLDIKKRFWTVWAKWLNSWGRLWKLQQCSYQRSARTLAGSKSLGIMKTKFSHNLIHCFQTQLCWFLTLLYRLTGTDVYFFFQVWLATQSTHFLRQSWLQLQYMKKNSFSLNLLSMMNRAFHSKSTFWQSQFICEVNAYFSLCETRFEDNKILEW